MNLGDPELELIDPTPNVHALFVQFDRLFFWTKLANRAVVRWSKRMYSCAGTCSYEGRGGLCDIALSEPLLKLRPRKDLIETLLHEMIHAYLFITCKDQDRDGHGPNFKAHMYRINKFAGLNISIFHNFHDEVKLYQTHWWRCNGPCQTWKPYFGIVRRTTNRAPGPSDYWWKQHQRNCGGTFIKMKEPEQKPIKKSVSKSNGDIMKYINNKKVVSSNVPNNINTLKSITPNGPIKSNIIRKPNSVNTVVDIQKVITARPQTNKPVDVFNGKGQTINNGRIRSNSVDVVDAVRNAWAHKKLPNSPISVQNTQKRKDVTNTNVGINPNTNTIKHKANSVDLNSPPAKLKKIDNYFKKSATSILKDLYGNDIKITESNDKKLVAVTNKSNLVDCPVCNVRVANNDINRHLDECLNKEVIEKICNEQKETNSINRNNTSIPSSESNTQELKKIVGNLPPIPEFKAKILSSHNYVNGNMKSNEAKITTTSVTTPLLENARVKNEVNIMQTKSDIHNTAIHFDPTDVNKVKSIVKKINYDKHIRKSDNFVISKEKKNEVDFGVLPSCLDDIACDVKVPPVKIEPGTSKDIVPSLTEQKCPCCNIKIDKPLEEHLEECITFFVNTATIPEENASTSFANHTIVIDDDDDDIFDETLTLNATGTKSPCPCCLQMIEQAEMNNHLEKCLS